MRNCLPLEAATEAPAACECVNVDAHIAAVILTWQNKSAEKVTGVTAASQVTSSANCSPSHPPCTLS
jgi:hypothetical protein